MKKTRSLRLAKRLFILLILTCGLIAVHTQALTTVVDLCSQCTDDFNRCNSDVEGAYFSCTAGNTVLSPFCINYTLSTYYDCSEDCSIFSSEPGVYTTCTNRCFESYAEGMESCVNTEIQTTEACNEYRSNATNWCQEKDFECVVYFCFRDIDGGGGFGPYTGTGGN